MLIMMLWMFTQTHRQGEWAVNTDDFEEIPRYVTSPQVAADGHIFFLDTHHVRVYHLGPEGNVLQVFGSKGKGPGELEYAQGLQLSVDGSKVFLVNPLNHKVYAFSRDGTLLGNPFTLEETIPYWFSDHWEALVKTQDPYLHPNQGCKVMLRTPQGWHELAAFGPELHADPYIWDDPKKGSRGMFSPHWRRQVSIAPSPDHRLLFVGSNDTLHVRIFDLSNGKELGSIQDDRLVKPLLTKEIIEKFDIVAGRGDDAVYLKDFEHPSTQPAIFGFQVDTLNRLWVFVNRPNFTDEHLYRIYSKNSELVGEVNLKQGYLFHADESYVWTSRSNEMDDYILAKERYELKKPQP